MRDRNAPGRPREFDDTEMLRKIMTLFWKTGFDGVSLSHIMNETGLQKASLYAAFGDKRTMYLKALSQYHNDVVTAAARALKDVTVPAEDRISAFLSAPLAAAEQNDRAGCFLCNASADQADLDTDTKTQVMRGFEHLAAALAAPLAERNPILTSDELARKSEALLAVYTGLRIMVRSGLPLNRLAGIVPHAMCIAG